jgi:hypothetical protein
MMVDLFKVEESSGGCGGELSEVPTTGGCPLLGVPTYDKCPQRRIQHFFHITITHNCALYTWHILKSHLALESHRIKKRNGLPCTEAGPTTTVSGEVTGQRGLNTCRKIKPSVQVIQTLLNLRSQEIHWNFTFHEPSRSAALIKEVRMPALFGLVHI